MRLMTIWQNSFIELLCCRCLMRLDRLQKLLNGDPTILEENYSSKQMLKYTREEILSNLKTIANNSEGRVRQLLKIVKALDL